MNKKIAAIVELATGLRVAGILDETEFAGEKFARLETFVKNPIRRHDSNLKLTHVLIDPRQITTITEVDEGTISRFNVNNPFEHSTATELRIPGLSDSEEPPKAARGPGDPAKGTKIASLVAEFLRSQGIKGFEVMSPDGSVVVGCGDPTCLTCPGKTKPAGETKESDVAKSNREFFDTLNANMHAATPLHNGGCDCPACARKVFEKGEAEAAKPETIDI